MGQNFRNSLAFKFWRTLLFLTQGFTFVSLHDKPFLMNDRDVHFMTLALKQAKAAQKAGEVPVGAVIVDPNTDSIISFGRPKA